jgi:nicotinamidase-related amidase
MCVSATARSALDHGYSSTVVASACATRDLPDPVSGEVVPASELHRSCLAGLHDRFALVVRGPSAWAA